MEAAFRAERKLRIQIDQKQMTGRSEYRRASVAQEPTDMAGICVFLLAALSIIAAWRSCDA